MAPISVRQSSFAAGEVSPSFFGRTDFAKYDIALRKVRNWIIGPQGSAFNRAGTTYCGTTKTTGNKVRLIPFQFSDGQSYVMEFGNLYMRLYRNGAPVLNESDGVSGPHNPGSTYAKDFTVSYAGYIYIANYAHSSSPSPVAGASSAVWRCLGPVNGVTTIDSPYTTSDLPHLKFAQSGDVITFASQYHVPYQLKRRIGLAGVSFIYTNNFLWEISKMAYGGAATHHSAERLQYVALSTTAGDGFTGFYSPEKNGPMPGAAILENMKIWGYAITVVVDGVEYRAMYSNELYTLPAAAKPSYNSTTTVRGAPVTVQWYPYGGPATSPIQQYRIYKGRGGPEGTYGLLTILDGDQPLVAGANVQWVDDGSLPVDYTVQPPKGGQFPGTNCDGLGSIPFMTLLNTYARGDIVAVGDVPALGDRIYLCTESGTVYNANMTHLDGEKLSRDPVAGPWHRFEKSTFAVNDLLISNGNAYACTAIGTGVINPGPLTTWTGPTGLSTGPDGGATFAYNSQFFGIAKWKYLGRRQNIQIGFPGVVVYADQRLIFANSLMQPGHIWGSELANYVNFFDVHLPVLPTDPYDFDLAYNTYEEIRGFIPAPKAFLAMTSHVEWALTTGINDPITATSIAARPNSQRGCEWLDPKLIGNAGVFVQARTPRIRELLFDFYTQSYGGNDLSQLSTHLFDGYTIMDWAYTRVPVSTIWAIRSDGVLLGCTYIREQEFLAWHWHDTSGGSFEQVCAVSEADPSSPGTYIDAIYVVVKRGTARYIERFYPRFIPRNADGTWDTVRGVFVDAAVLYRTVADTLAVGTTVAAGTKVFTGLSHLEGSQVKALIDGYTYGPYTVTAGQIDVSAACAAGVQTRAIIGLTYLSDLEFLPPKVPGADIKRSNVKLVPKISMEFADSRGEVWVGPNYSNLKLWAPRNVLDSYGVPIPRTGLEHVRLTGVGYDHDATLCIRQTGPLPVNLLAVEREIDVGGD